MTFEVREMTRADVPACVAIVNHTITQGQSTAYEEHFTETSFADQYLDEAEVSNVVLWNGRAVSFQGAFLVDEGIYSIGSFTDRQNPVRGAGSALFAKTSADCRAAGGTAILAKITSDNSGGLAFYSKMGFVDDHIVPNDHTRPDGTRVDRVIKRFAL